MGHMNDAVAPLNLSVWQAASTPGDLADNLRRLDEAAERAAAAGSELLITPEMYLTGYNIGDGIARLAAEQPLERVAEIAARHGIGIVAGGPESLPGGGIANAAWLFDERGAVLARHHKVQLFGALDREHFEAGSAPVTIAEFRGWRVALLICFDVEYPETVRAAAHAGADLVAVPTAQMAPFAFVNEHLIRVRAWENALFVAYANQIGPDGEFEYVGRSVIANPLGEHLAEASPEREELISAALSPAVLKTARSQNTYLGEVRRDLFSGTRATH